MMVLAASLGWYGIAMGLLAMSIHLTAISSCGVPYFDGFSWTRDLQDSVVRMPLWTMVKRPRLIARGDTTRLHPFTPPLSPSGSGSSDRGGQHDESSSSSSRGKRS
jgi:spore germination protein KA